MEALSVKSVKINMISHDNWRSMSVLFMASLSFSTITTTTIKSVPMKADVFLPKRNPLTVGSEFFLNE